MSRPLANSNKANFSKIDEHSKSLDTMHNKSKIPYVSNSNSLKNKLVLLDNTVYYIYKEVDTTKKTLNSLKIDTDKMLEQMSTRMTKMDKAQKDKAEKIRIKTDDEFSKQRNENKEFSTNVKIMKENHLKMNIQLSRLQKKLYALSLHVGLAIDK